MTGGGRCSDPGDGESQEDMSEEEEDDEEEDGMRGTEEWFAAGMTFGTYAEFLQRKKAYEESTGVHLSLDQAGFS
jgi:hypothetical protein